MSEPKRGLMCVLVEPMRGYQGIAGFSGAQSEVHCCSTYVAVKSTAAPFPYSQSCLSLPYKLKQFHDFGNKTLWSVLKFHV